MSIERCDIEKGTNDFSLVMSYNVRERKVAKILELWIIGIRKDERCLDEERWKNGH